MEIVDNNKNKFNKKLDKKLKKQYTDNVKSLVRQGQNGLVYF